jgi:predicted patatin/cPLA2 family phospholipase
MSHIGQTFDRAYLQNVRTLQRRQYIQQWINDQLHHQIVAAAADGNTSYVVTQKFMPHMPNTGNIYQGHVQQPQPPFTSEELVELLQKKYPGCDVSYNEEWVDTNSSTRVLQKGIVIDWS